MQAVCWFRGERKGKKHKSQALNHTKPDVCRFRSGDELSQLRLKCGISSVLDTWESTLKRNFAWGGVAGASWAGTWIWALLWASLVSTKGLSGRCHLTAPPAAASLLCTAWGCVPEQPPGNGPHLPGRDSISAGGGAGEALVPLQPRRLWLAAGTVPQAAALSPVPFPGVLPRALGTCTSFCPKPCTTAGFRHSETTRQPFP